MIAFASGPLLARGLGPEERGQFAASIAVLSMAAFAADLGLSNSIMIWTARSGGINPSLTRWTLKRYTLSLAVVVAAMLIFGYYGWIAFSYWIFAGLPIVLCGNLVRAPIAAMGLTFWLALERWTQALTRLLLVAALVLVGELTHSRAVLVHITSLAVSAALLPLAWRKLKRSALKPNFNVTTFGLLTCGNGLASIVLVRLDQLVLLPVAGAHALGIYAVAASLGETPLLLSTALRMTFEGKVASMQSARPMFFPVFVCVASGLSAVGVSLIFGPWFVNLLYGSEFASATAIFVVLLLASTPAMIVDLCGGSLMALGRPGIQWRITTVSAVATLILLYPFTARFGALGAAYVTLIAYSISAIASLIELTRLDPGWIRFRRASDSEDHSHPNKFLALEIQDSQPPNREQSV